MTTYIAANLTLFLVVLAVGLLQRRHGRVHVGYPHLPLGADESQDADLRRVLHDLDGHPDMHPDVYADQPVRSHAA